MSAAVAQTTSPPQPGSRALGPIAPPIADNATIVVRNLSKWYGDVVAVSDVTFGVEPGVTALLGPNGAGKSTTLEMLTGLLAPSAGTIRVLGKPARGDESLYRQVGLVPEQETIYPFLTGYEFVRLNAVLQKLPDPDAATRRALEIVELVADAERPIRGYSKGMRQRIKVAAAMVHEPDVLLMDEPLNGMDPAQRLHMINLIRELGRTKTVMVSSHILAEVERFAENVIVIVNGKLAAAGDFRAIRDRIDTHDHAVRIRSNEPRFLAMALIGHPSTKSVRIDREDRLVVETQDVRGFYIALPQLARKANVRLIDVSAADESLASVFSYLVEG
jgi:ABC-2 type transport system ATP-binding protein